MKIFRHVIDFYIEASIHVALAVVSLFWITSFYLNIPYYLNGAFFVFFATIVGYNFVKYDELARVKKVELTAKFKAIIVLSFMSALAAFYFFLKLHYVLQLIAVGSFLLTVLYTLPFLPKHKNLRNFSGIKIYIVALAWAVVTVLMPLAVEQIDIFKVVVLFVQRFIFIFVLLLIFEINDLNKDAPYLQTIPQKIGIRNTKKLAYFFTLLFLTLEFLISPLFSSAFLVLFFTTLLLLLFIYFSSNNRNSYYTSFWVESLPFFWLAMLLIEIALWSF